MATVPGALEYHSNGVIPVTPLPGDASSASSPIHPPLVTMLRHVGWHYREARDPRKLYCRAIYNEMGIFVADLEYSECLALLKSSGRRGTVYHMPLPDVSC